MTNSLFTSYEWLLQEFAVLIKQRELRRRVKLLSISAEEWSFYISIGMQNLWSSYFRGIPVFFKEAESNEPHYIPREDIEYLASITPVLTAKQQYMRELEILQKTERSLGNPFRSAL